MTLDQAKAVLLEDALSGGKTDSNRWFNAMSLAGRIMYGTRYEHMSQHDGYTKWITTPNKTTAEFSMAVLVKLNELLTQTG